MKCANKSPIPPFAECPVQLRGHPCPRNCNGVRAMLRSMDAAQRSDWLVSPRRRFAEAHGGTAPNTACPVRRVRCTAERARRCSVPDGQDRRKGPDRFGGGGGRLTPRSAAGAAGKEHDTARNLNRGPGRLQRMVRPRHPLRPARTACADRSNTCPSATPSRVRGAASRNARSGRSAGRTTDPPIRPGAPGSATAGRGSAGRQASHPPDQSLIPQPAAEPGPEPRNPRPGAPYQQAAKNHDSAARRPHEQVAVKAHPPGSLSVLLACHTLLTEWPNTLLVAPAQPIAASARRFSLDGRRPSRLTDRKPPVNHCANDFRRRTTRSAAGAAWGR